jgi:HEPN domain-containing protein
MPLPFEPQNQLSRAAQFRRVAISLPDMEGPEPNWPKYFLLGHAIELALKAYLEFSGGQGSIGNHDLHGLYAEAVRRGFPVDAQTTADLPHLSELHRINYARYPQVPVRPVALISQFDDIADGLISKASKLIGW